jgi:hypothetical protein
MVVCADFRTGSTGALGVEPDELQAANAAQTTTDDDQRMPSLLAGGAQRNGVAARER